MDTHFFFRNKEASPPPARHRRTGIVLLVLAAALLTVLLTAWAMFGTQLQAAMTIQKLDDGLWSMEYRGDYGFDDFLAQGGASSDAEMGDYLAAYMSSASRSPTICMVLYRRFRDSTVFSTMAAMGSFPSARAWAATSTQRLVIWP